MRRVLTLTLLAAVVAASAAGCGTGDAGEPAGLATASLPPADTSPQAATAVPTTEGGSSSGGVTPAVAGRAEVGTPVVYSTWLDERGFIRVNFVTQVRNTGSVPVEVASVRWALNDRAGAPFAFGVVEHGYPRHLAPGEAGILGGFIGGISYTDPKEVTGVTLLLEPRSAAGADRLLETEAVEVTRDAEGVPRVVGRVRNGGTEAVGQLRIGIVVQDTEGRWLAFAEGEPDLTRLDPGEATAFRSAGLVPSDLPAEPASALVVAFDAGS